jgi:hypothetical protein
MRTLLCCPFRALILVKRHGSALQEIVQSARSNIFESKLFSLEMQTPELRDEKLGKPLPHFLC